MLMKMASSRNDFGEVFLGEASDEIMHLSKR
jgi:hypothetical protein